MVFFHNLLTTFAYRCHLTNLIAVGAGDNSITIFQEEHSSKESSTPTFNLFVRTQQAHEQDVNAVAWSPKSPGILASCSDDGLIKLWKVSDSEGLPLLNTTDAND